MTDILLSGATGVNWVSLAAATTFKDIPRQKFRKEVVKIGKYVKDAEGKEFEIGIDALENWVAQFQRMRKGGEMVRICSTHAGASDPDLQRGVVEDLFIDGDSLVMTCELIGKDGIEAAARNDVSIYSSPEFVGGNGSRYIRPITHIALCPDPVVTGLGEFVPLAASLNANNKAKGVSMNWTKVQKAFDVKEELTDANAEEVLLSFAKSAGETTKRLTDAQALLDKAKNLSEETKKKDKGDTKLSREVDPVTVKLLADNRKLKLDALVLGAKITPAVRDDLKAVWTDKEAIAAELSRSSDDDVFDRVIAAIAKNDPIKLKEQSGPQANVELARSMDSDKPNPLVAACEARAKAAEKSGG